jgi:hypothetical protein
MDPGCSAVEVVGGTPPLGSPGWPTHATVGAPRPRPTERGSSRPGAGRLSESDVCTRSLVRCKGPLWGASGATGRRGQTGASATVRGLFFFSPFFAKQFPVALPVCPQHPTPLTVRQTHIIAYYVGQGAERNQAMPSLRMFTSPPDKTGIGR